MGRAPGDRVMDAWATLRLIGERLEASTVEDVVQGFTTREAQRLTGLSQARLAYWDDTGFIRPSVAPRMDRSIPRLYGFRDLIELRVAKHLRAHLPLQALRRLKSYLQVDAPFAVVSFGIQPDGEVVYLGHDGRREAARQPGQILMTFDVPLEAIRTDLARSVEQMRRRRGAGKIRQVRGVMAHQPTLSGTRIRPETVRRLLAASWSEERILDEYPELTRSDIAAARKYVPARRRAAS